MILCPIHFTRWEAQNKSYKFPSFVADEIKSKFVWYFCRQFKILFFKWKSYYHIIFNSKSNNLYDLFCASLLVKWMGHKIIILYYTFHPRYLCFLNDLLYEMSIVFFVRYIYILWITAISLWLLNILFKKKKMHND
jgi:hypothetical protein